jgi:hypothetical protein
MSHRVVGQRRAARAPAVAAAVVLLAIAGLLVPGGPASAGAATPMVTVDPDTGLADRQAVSVTVTDFPADQNVFVLECPATATTGSECGVGTLTRAETEASGTVTLDFTVERVIFTNQLGVIDCAETACVIAAGTFDEAVVATAPLGFDDAPLPPAPFTIAFTEPHFLTGSGSFGLATLRARLTCNVTASVSVRFHIAQSVGGGGTTTASSSFTYPCTPGADTEVFSDHLAAFTAGSAQALVAASTDDHVSGEVDTVTLQSASATLAALNAALNGPGGAAVRAELLDAIDWRITYNPEFRRYLYRAILLGEGAVVPS